MAQNITLLGASYTAVPAVTLPKTGGGTAKFSDASVTTAVESDVAEGKTFLLADGSIGMGTASGGGGGYTRTVIAEEQTVTPVSTSLNGSTYYGATLNVSEGFEADAEYIITFNGTEYFFTCQVLWGTNFVLGDINYFYGGSSLPYPFGILWVSGTTCTLARDNGNQVTVKIEKLELTGSGGGAPSATAHTLYFEFTDSTNTTITAYWDDSFISDAITETVPTTYGSKTVTLAQLDGVTWYSFDPTERWETMFDGDINWMHEDNGDYPYCWISSLGNTPITVGSVWRITYDDTEYRCTAKSISLNGSNYECIGNPVWSGSTDDGSGVPFVLIDYTHYGAWSGGLNAPNVNSNYHFKIERQVTT